MNIMGVTQEDYIELIEVWESSVRATHDFLPENQIQELKPLILEQYFDAVNLMCAKNDKGKIVGFYGVAAGNLEMLFISSECRGTGIGTALCNHAISHNGVTKLDVNEQNGQAVGFYKHIGFCEIGRSPLDGQGNPYPLLHMELKAKQS